MTEVEKQILLNQVTIIDMLAKSCLKKESIKEISAELENYRQEIILDGMQEKIKIVSDGETAIILKDGAKLDGVIDIKFSIKGNGISCVINQFKKNDEGGFALNADGDNFLIEEIEIFEQQGE